ncbi:COP9 signalosome complex subunit 7b isoform X1 [Penaeus vannamei]|uniref:COP9 signalosome complex subunit 7a n=2 Tax=Penaeus vannamei TaxID=6689 RepID=A0A3R7T037_PENVA|nr:COP9 signalosome complex subunit 7b-like isoform X1 [Penaeus vannamei]ROT83663.1 COP9 signalosome complex subunit 7a [Penaeus vannamei]
MSAANMTAADKDSKNMGDKASQSNPAEQYILLAKQAKGAAAVQLVKQVLEAPEVYVFGELLDMPNITDLKDNPQHAPYYEVLQLFAYGVYADYIRESSKYPPLTPAMLTKLRHLTIVSMATGQKSIPLPTLGTQLGLTSTRELEDLIIEAMYTDIIHGKLDQKNGILELDYAIGRDIKPEDLPNIVGTLQSWCDTCDTMLANIDQLITRANSDKEKHLKHRNSLEAEVLNIKASLKTQAQEGDEALVSDSRDHDKKRPAKKGIRASSSKFWPKSS